VEEVEGDDIFPNAEGLEANAENADPEDGADGAPNAEGVVIPADECPKADTREGGWPKVDCWPKALGADGLENAPKPPPPPLLLALVEGLPNAEGCPNDDDVPKAEVVCGVPKDGCPNDGVEAEAPNADGCEVEEDDADANALGLFANEPNPPPLDVFPNALVATGAPKAEGRVRVVPKDDCPNAGVV